jgi:hypothetical protein
MALLVVQAEVRQTNLLANLVLVMKVHIHP